jgi:hypothetical protein
MVCHRYIQSHINFIFSVLDSFGKPPPGINRGNRIWLGSFDQCRASTIGPKQDAIYNEYCTAEVAFPGTENEVSFYHFHSRSWPGRWAETASVLNAIFSANFAAPAALPAIEYHARRHQRCRGAAYIWQ